MWNDLSVAAYQFVNFCLNLVFFLYQVLERILPGILFYNGDHAWWHNLICVLGWISLYIFLARKYHGFAKFVRNKLSVLAWNRCGCVLFPWWHWLCYLPAPFLYAAASSYGWPALLKLVAGAAVMAPMIYLIVKGRLAFPLLLLYQIIILLVMAVYLVVFLPIAVLALLLLGLAYVFNEVSRDAGESKRSIERSPCPICGQTGGCSHRR